MAKVVDELKRVPLLAGLNQQHLRRLASKVKERHFSPGTTVVQEGTMSGVGFFIIASGEASVSVRGDEISRLEAGDHFGALALIAERERSATVTALTPLDCFEIMAWDFREFVKDDPDASWSLLQYVVSLLLDEQRTTA
jgi:CRP-like cAMP-binding protein